MLFDISELREVYYFLDFFIFTWFHSKSHIVFYINSLILPAFKKQASWNYPG